MTAAHVLVFPAWRDNPYLTMLSLAARARQYRFLSATTFSSLIAQGDRLGSGDVLHIHWTSPIIQQAGSREEAATRLEHLRRALKAWHARGVRLVWTIHNRLPHEMVYRDKEIQLYRLLAASADRIHVMAPETASLVADVCELPAERVIVIAHPSYAGIYDGTIDRAHARRSFGLSREDHSVLFLGQIRPYKGVEALVEAVQRVRRPDGHEPVLLLAGAPKDGAEETIHELVPASLRAHTHFEFVADADIARWFLAADVAVFPYRAILNSGSVHLAATFRVPTILPDEPHLRQQFADEPWIGFFDPSAPAESIAALISDPDTFAGLDERGFDDFLERTSPWEVSRAYADMLDDVTAA